MKDGHTIPEDEQDNKLNLFNVNDIHYVEAIGVAKAERHIFEFYKDAPVDMYSLMDLHKMAFGELYDWAGKIRTTITNIGVPPFQILERLKSFMDNLQYRLNIIDYEDDEEVIQLLAETHHTIVYIHPFLNGNGRIARLFTNLVAIKLMRPPFEIYVRDTSKDRSIYIDAIRKADKGDYEPLKNLIRNSLKYSEERYRNFRENSENNNLDSNDMQEISSK